MKRETSRRWRTLRRLPWSERRSAAVALLALTGIRLALASLGFRRVHGLLSRWVAASAPGAQRPPALRAAQAAATLRALDRAAGCGPSRPSCLPRSLTLWWLLRRQGMPAELRIGVRREGDRLEAHAWVEQDGVVLGDHADVHDRFHAFVGSIQTGG